MKSELTRSIRSAQHIWMLLLQRFSDSVMQARFLRGEEVGVDDFSEEWMPEPVRVAVVVDH